MNKSIVFIDLDGTILDVFDRYWAVHAESAKKIHRKSISKQFYKRLRRIGYYEKKIYKEKYKASQKEIDIAYAVWFKEIEEKKYLRKDKVQKGVKGLLQKLSKYYTLILVSDRINRETAEWQLKRLMLYPIFDSVYFVGGINRKSEKKWMPKYKTIKKNYSDRGGIIIGDTESDVCAGKKLGITTFAVADGLRTKEYLKELMPSKIFPNINSAIRVLLRI